MTYKVTIRVNGKEKTIDVDASKAPFSRDGEPGSLLDIALGSGFDIDHACGGVSACATCHVVVTEGLSSIPDAEEEEEDQLDLAPGLTTRSRLACQCIPDGSIDVVFEVPSWNRNHVSEEH
ncbi:MAG: 2Fe-2S iron-sulfur cluster-binding protein [Planctomycetota bacterium]|nr:2Fe-2S iron-sulfur cluster-binding protein [Planctomycetota bacterium]